MKRRVLMLATQLGYGGAETSFIRLANALAETHEITVALFTPTYGGTVYAQGHETLNARIVLLDEAGHSRLTRWWNRIQKLRALKLQHDLCISFLSGPNLVNALSGRGARSIISLRGSRHFDPVAPRAQNLLFRYLLDPLIYARVGRIVPVSPGLALEVGQVQRRKVRVIPPFLELATIRGKLAAPAPEAFAALKGQPVIVSVGRLSIEKGFQHLIRIFHTISQQRPGAKLLLVGDGPMREALRAQCSALGLALDDVSQGSSSVIFTGYQQNVLAFMALGKVYALTSATEGFPSVLLEAMIAGLPVLAADTPWGAHFILTGTAQTIPYPTSTPTRTECGTLMPRIDDAAFAQCWESALQEAFDAPRAGTCSRPEDFTREKVVAQWLQLIEEVTHG